MIPTFGMPFNNLSDTDKTTDMHAFCLIYPFCNWFSGNRKLLPFEQSTIKFSFFIVGTCMIDLMNEDVARSY